MRLPVSFAVLCPILWGSLLVTGARGDASGPLGTWYLTADGSSLTMTIKPGTTPGTYHGRILDEKAGVAPEPLDEIHWDATTRELGFRRKAKGVSESYRGKVVEGVLVGRFSWSEESPAGAVPSEAYRYHVTGWNSTYIDRQPTPRVYEILINKNYRGRLRIDSAPDGVSVYAGRLKVYSTVQAGSAGEEVEHDLQITQWDGTNLRFIRRGESWTQDFTGIATGRTLSGTFIHSGSDETLAWSGTRAEVLGYGFRPREPDERATWQERTRRQLFHLMMAGNPAPLSRRVTDVNGTGPTSDLSPLTATKWPPHRDDDPDHWPQNYRLRELQFDYTLPNPYDAPPLARRSHGYLATPTTPPPPSGKYPAVLAVNGHGGSAWQVMDPGSGPFWYGDSFARRGFVVLAVDISHRPTSDRRGLYAGSLNGDDPAHGNSSHPSIKAKGFDSDWEEDGERVWDVMRATDYLLSLPQVDPDRLLITGLSMGGEIASLTGGLDPRFALSIPSGYSPDMGVLVHNGNHECWRWLNADIREYIDASDLYAMTAPRALIIQTGKQDRTFSVFRPPYAADKQVVRRARVAYGGQGHRFVFYLHYDGHNYHVGGRNPTRPTESGVRVPEMLEPISPWSFDWQFDERTAPERSDLFDYVNFYLNMR